MQKCMPCHNPLRAPRCTVILYIENVCCGLQNVCCAYTRSLPSLNCSLWLLFAPFIVPVALIPLWLPFPSCVIFSISSFSHHEHLSNVANCQFILRLPPQAFWVGPACPLLSATVAVTRRNLSASRSVSFTVQEMLVTSADPVAPPRGAASAIVRCMKQPRPPAGWAKE